MKCALLCAVVAWSVGCVRPWERGDLSHRGMQPQGAEEASAEKFCSHAYDVREGATGGLGRPGGGCGCN